jgi:hypothetical protein
MSRRIVSFILWCLIAFYSENVLAYETIGLVLDFPEGRLDSVTKIDMTISSEPLVIIGFFNISGYTSMVCNRAAPDPPCPGYKDIPDYIKYLDPTYNGLVLSGALGLDWQREPWTPANKKIIYMGGDDTLQPGIVDGYAYHPNHPLVTNVVLFGYPGKTKWSYFDTGENVNQSGFSFDVWAIVVEDEWHLSDAILVTQTMAGMNPAIPDDGPYDINGDEKIGLQELVYILQKLAGLRSLKERF